MHNCEEFRERITEHIIDRVDVAAKAEFQHELLMCSSCSEFCADSREMIDVLSEIDLSISENQWNGIRQRLHAHIRNATPVGAGLGSNAARWSLSVIAKQDSNVRTQSAVRERPRVAVPGRRIPVPVWVSAAALLLVTIGLSRLTTPTGSPVPAEPAAVFVEHSVPLDPVTIDFLEESELLLRNVMKIEPANVSGLEDARKVAGVQLAELKQRKEAVAEAPPVVGVMETYETILRDLRNVDEQNADEDISDIQKRIEKNGLIANIKAFQPRVTEISFGLR